MDATESAPLVRETAWPERQLEQALAVAARVHGASVDRAGRPYLGHPLRVLERVAPDMDAMTAAALHDVVEDSELSVAELREVGFDERIVAAVDALSRRAGEDYADYIERLLPDALARRVKQADLLDNMDLSRLPQLSERDWERVCRYHAALIRLRAWDDPR